MPRTSKPCRKCRKSLTRDRSGYCDACKPADESNWQKWQQRHGTRHERGYGTRWDKLRATILERDNCLCQICLSDGIYTNATHVDHIVPKAQGGKDVESNLQALCRPCHEAKTASERGGGGSNL